MIKGANAPLLEKTVRHQVSLMKQNLPIVEYSCPELSFFNNGLVAKPNTLILPSTELKAGESTECLILVKPNLSENIDFIDSIRTAAKKDEFQIKKLCKVWLSKAQADQISREVPVEYLKDETTLLTW